MKVKDLKPGTGKVDIEVEVVDVGEPKTFEKFGRSGKVVNATVKDDTGSIKMSFWNENADKVKPGMKVKVTNGYVNEFQGESQLTAGKFGNLEFLEEEKPKK